MYAFKKQGNKFIAQKTDLLNPWESGASLEEQLQGTLPNRGDNVTVHPDSVWRSVNASLYVRRLVSV
jgi:hypothetical protein